MYLFIKNKPFSSIPIPINQTNFAPFPTAISVVYKILALLVKLNISTILIIH